VTLIFMTKSENTTIAGSQVDASQGGGSPVARQHNDK